MEEYWREAPRQEGNAQLAACLGISPMTVRLIRSRGVEGEEEIRKYLRGTLKDLHDPFQMKGMEKAVELLTEKIREGAPLRVIGDYDIDGVNATYILLTGFKRIGAQVDTVIPDRLKDGYGLNENLIRAAKAEGIDTIVTCDNGIAAAAEIALGRELGMTLVVTDHHEVPFEEDAQGERHYLLPPAHVILNPKQADCPYPFKKLCGAAVAYKLIQALYRRHFIPEEELLDFLEFVAMATVGDIMELQGENRIFVRYGLERLEQTKNLGYRALIMVNGLGEKKLTPYHVGFVLGPCINASGRLDTARRALNLLTSETWENAQELAGDLKALNDSRKELTIKGTEEAIALIESGAFGQDRVLVIYLPDCHESLAGIIAGRLKERYYRPCFVLTRGEEGIKGSGRSIETYSMYEEMTKVKDLFAKFGGHPMAAGLSLKGEQVEEFRRRINEVCTLSREELMAVQDFDGVLRLQYVGEQLLKELELLKPYGKGNPQPLFAESGVRMKSGRVMGKDQNVLKLQLKTVQGAQMEGIYFGDGNRMLEDMEAKESFSMLYYPEVNEYMGKHTIQIVVKGVR
ncbi:MAG: single-stranded-DNA-specific exonuclease RecJ [Lachnospiraceae bacterium]|nr:single-stranded-DNA-specific exonuclease RecJ [Lachnospiraceae bacterium]